MKREMFLVPQAMIDKMVIRYGFEKLGEFTFLLSQYCAWWDEHGSGDGFDFSKYSETVLNYFDAVADAVDERHRQYVAEGEKMRSAAQARWEKEEKLKRIREQKRRWYVDNSKNLNKKRKEQRAEEKMAVKKDFSSHRAQSLISQGTAKNDAEYRNYEYYEHNRNLKTYGGRARDAVDNFDRKPDKHNRSGGLTGHNPACGAVVNAEKRKKKHQKRRWKQEREKEAVRNHNPACGAVVKENEIIRKNERGNPKAEREKAQREERPTIWPRGRCGASLLASDERQRREASVTEKAENHKPPQPCGQLPHGGGGAELGKKNVRPMVVRPTVYAKDWVKIGDDFELDLFDPAFADFARGSRFLRRGFEMFCRKKFCGEKHDKWWLRRLLGNFAVRQGKIGYMYEEGGR